MPTKNNIARRARRKKQTRLTFDPIPSDAAAAPSSDTGGPGPSSRGSNFSPAKVGYTINTDKLNTRSQTTITPFKTKSKGLAGVSGETLDGQRKTMPVVELPPTPVKNAGVVGKVNCRNVNAPATAPLNNYDDDDSDIDPFPSSRCVRNSSPPTASKQPNRQVRDRADDTSDDSPPEDDSQEIVKKNKKKRTPKKTTKTSSPILISEDDEDDEDNELQLPTMKRTPRSFIKGGNTYAAPIGSSERRNSGSRRARSSVKSRKQKSVTPSDEDDGDELVLLPKRSTRKIPPAEEALSLEDDSDEIFTTSSARRMPKPIVAPDDEDDDSDEIISPLKRRRQVTEELDSDIEISPLKRRRAATKPEVKTPTRKTRQQRPRKRTAKEKTMELLKRKRAGEKIDKLTDSESNSGEDKAAIYDTDSDLEVLSAFDDESEAEIGIQEVSKPSRARKQKQKQKRRASEGEDEDYEDDTFITDDDEGPLGVPSSAGLHDIPLEFTHHAHKPLKEHFKDAIEWMIHNKINPSFAREDPIYRAAFRKLDDEVHGYASSKYVSSAWTADFNKALHARPHCSERELDAAAIDMKCDACNRSNHPPKFAISFEGKAYSKDTLEEIEQDSDNEDSDDSDNGSVNSKGQSLPADGKEWFVGRFCRSNATTAHALIHWKHALNEWVIDNLEGGGQLSPAKLAERDKMKAKQRKKSANKLVDNWDEQGVIKSLYGDFKRSLEAAREGKPESRWG